MLRLGVCHLSIGELKKGRQIADQAVALLEAEYGEVSSTVADALTDIAVAYLERVRNFWGWDRVGRTGARGGAWGISFAAAEFSVAKKRRLWGCTMLSRQTQRLSAVV